VILVTGATGHVGRELVEQLLAAGVKVRVLTRDKQKAERFRGRTEVAVGDLEKPETVVAAMKGVAQLFLMSASHGPEQTANAVDAAKKNGVRRVVNLSSIGASLSPMPEMGRWHFVREQLIKDSGLAWTFLRPGMFMSNALQWAATIKAEGNVYHPTGAGKYAPIDSADVAAVAAQALLRPGHEGKVYELTGVELLSAPEQVGILSAVLQRPIEYVDVSPDDSAEKMRRAGAPRSLVAATKELMRLVRSGSADLVTQTVEGVTGSAPKSFENWCRRHAEAFK
jgi:(4-alkanoyl-5-oxo-2,5-dihydrofuran-3-yl)methyl phosphate reductase